ncbi:MAG: hypothetical protein Ta2G_20240 [Termitinemataceae bacterium]|nr:MAG: hypothetical protein Ta2G_20240 [Termitinemataceae bacterium]
MAGGSKKIRGGGAFVLLRTSNSGCADFECQTLKDGSTLFESLGLKLADLAKKECCNCGYGIFGAVVGCTDTKEAAKIRAAYENLFFLIPGYGAQGGGANDARLLLNKDGNGGVVNASRSILKAWQSGPSSEAAPITSIKAAAEAAAEAAIKMRDDIRG